MGLRDKNVLLGVTGSISAYKACDLVQRLKDEGANVRVIMTPSAAKLVHPNTFAALTAYRVVVDGWSGVEGGAMDHIDLARWADIYLIAPCTAHTLGELAHGLTGSLLSLVYLVYAGNAYIAPAMNSVMLDAPAVTAQSGNPARPKAMSSFPREKAFWRAAKPATASCWTWPISSPTCPPAWPWANPYPGLQGKRVLISLGHTQEKWDDVRFLSNRSSGKTGLALARAFLLAGAQVHVVAGVTDEPVTPGPSVSRATTSADFQRELLGRQADADIIIMAAAISDFVPAQTHKGKQKDSKSLARMDLQPFPNILLELGKRKAEGQVLVGFALETTDVMTHARAKMTERNCDLMVVNNPVSDTTGFGKGQVMAAVISRKNAGASALLTEWDKDQLANAVAGHVHALLAGVAE